MFSHVMATILCDVVQSKENSRTESQWNLVQDSLVQQINQLKLSRERFACTEMLNALLHRRDVYELTLCYKYDGELYCVSKKPVQGTKFCGELIDKGFTSAEWDSFPQYSVWVHSGKIFGTIK